MVFVVAGLDALHRTAGDCVFRWELARDLAGVSRDSPVTPDVFLRFFSDSILLKGVDRERCTVVLNKYDALRERSEALHLAKGIIGRTGCPEVVVTSVFHPLSYRVNRS
jgi:hypothetical protein